MPRKVFNTFPTDEVMSVDLGPHSKMSEEDQRWLQAEGDRVNQELGYRMNIRSSPDDALRLYLIARKGFTVDQALNLSELSPEELKQNFEEMFTAILDPKKSKRENLAELGKIHKEAMEKVSEFTMPDLTINSVKDMYSVYHYFKCLSGIMTNYIQDMDGIINRPDDPQDQMAYYAGAGGRTPIAKTVEKVNLMNVSVIGLMETMENVEFANSSKAYLLEGVKESVAEFSGKKIKDIPFISIQKAQNTSSTLMTAGLPQKAEVKPGQDPPFFLDYLEGNANRDAHLVNGKLPPLHNYDQIAQENLGTLLRTLSVHKLLEKDNAKSEIAKVKDVLTPDEAVAEDITSLPEEKRRQLESGFMGTFRETLGAEVISAVRSLDKDEFDIIHMPGGETVREMVDRKYPNMDAGQKYGAMMQEAMRGILTTGVSVDDIQIHSNGVITMKPPMVLVSVSPEERREMDTRAMDEGLTATREERKALFANEGSQELRAVSSLSPEELRRAGELYQQIFGTAFNEPGVLFYRNQNPGLSDLDFLQVRGQSLRDRLGQEHVNELQGSPEGRLQLQAEVLRLVTDPRIPVTFVGMEQNVQENTFRKQAPVFLMDEADRRRVLMEYPQLQDVEHYKEWSKKRYGEMMDGLDDAGWDFMYHDAFHIAVAEGLMPDDRITTKAEIRAKADPDDPQSANLMGIDSIYGAKPILIKEWLGNGSEGKTYTRDEFRTMKIHETGSFTNREFSVISYLAATHPEIVTGDPMPEIPDSDRITRADKLALKSTMWTADTCSSDVLKTRENMVSHFGEFAVEPARQAAADMIAAYDRKEPDNRLGRVLADGIRYVMVSLHTVDIISTPEGVGAHLLSMLGETEKILQERPELRQDVEKHLSEDDRKEYQSYLNLEQLRKDSLHAKARLAKEDEGGGIAPEERQRLENRIASFGYYATHWNDHMQSMRKSEEFKKEVDELPERLVDEADRTNNPNLLIGISPMKETAERRFLRPDPVMLEELRSDVRFAKGEHLQKNVETFETQLRDAVRQSRDSRAIVQKAGMNYTGEVSPKQLSEEWHNLEVSSWKLDTLLKETGGRLNKAIISEIYDTYNQTAREKGWKELSFGEKDSLRMSLLKVDNRMRDPEMVDVFHQAIVNTLHVHPEVTMGLWEKPEIFTFPEDRHFRQNEVYPKKEKIDKLKQNASQQDQEMLDEANLLLGERNPEIVTPISKAHKVKEVNGFLEQRACKGQPGFDPEKECFTNVTEKRDVIDGDYEYGMITQETREEVQRLLANPPKLSDNVKDYALPALDLMQKFGMINADAPLEQTVKFYSHHRVAQARMALGEAVDSGDLAKIRECSEVVKNEMLRERQVADILKAGFGDSYVMPDNLDSLREETVPMEITRDYGTDSRMNGLYLVGATAAKLGVKPEEYIADPAKYILKGVKDNIEKNGFNAGAREGRNFFERLENLYAIGENADGKEGREAAYGSAMTADLYVSRCLDGIYKLEDNPEKNREQIVYKRKLGQLVEQMANREYCYMLAVYEMAQEKSKATPEFVHDMREGLKCAFLEGGAIEKRHIALPYTTPEGVAQENDKSYRKALETKGAYEQIISEYRKNLPNAKESGSTLPKQLIQETMFDYLMAHPEDRNTAAYKNLEKVAKNAGKEMGLPEPQNEAEKRRSPQARYEQWQKDFVQEQKELQDALHDRDNMLNDELKAIQKSYRTNSISDRANPDLEEQFRDRIGTLVQRRETELLEARDRGEVTDHYLKLRIRDLEQLVKNPLAKIQEPPKLLGTPDSELYAEDMARINRRVSCNFGTGELRDLDSFKTWKKGQEGADMETLAELSETEWKQMFRNEMSRRMEQARRANPKSEPDWVRKQRIVTERRGAELAESEQTRKEEMAGLSEQSYQRLEKMLKNDALMEKLSQAKPDAKALRQVADAVAEPLAYEIVRKQNGIIPGDVPMDRFIKQVQENPGFRRVVQPVLKDVIDERRANQARPEGEAVNAAPSSYGRIVSMIRDGSLIGAATQEEVFLSKNPDAAKQNRPGPGLEAVKTRIERLKEAPKEAPRAKEQQPVGKEPKHRLGK